MILASELIPPSVAPDISLSHIWELANTNHAMTKLLCLAVMIILVPKVFKYGGRLIMMARSIVSP